MIDLVLVSPCNKKRIYGPLHSTLAAIEPPLWLGLTAAFVRERGFLVKVIDAGAENLAPEETAEKITKYNPRLAGIIVSGTNPSASTMNMPGAGVILRSLKEQSPDIKTLLGGLHPSVLPQKTLLEEEVDFVCQGEGVHTIAKLLEVLKSNKNDADYRINGLWYKKDGEIISNPREELVNDLDMLPFVAWDLLPMDKYKAHNWHCFQNIDSRMPYAVIYTSLGCPFKCSFCCINSIFGKAGIRYRNPQKVIEEIDILVRNYGVKNIKILDEMFVLNEDHVIEICDLIIKRGYDLNIWAYARIDTINENILKKMKQAGFSWLAFGIEAGSEKVRDGVSKGRFGRDAIFKSVKMTHDAGIHIGANYIFGLPDDDLYTMQETKELAIELNCEYSNFYVTMAYPGSQLYEGAIRQSVRLPDSWLGFSQYSDETLPLPTKYLSSSSVLSFRDKAFEEYYGGSRFLEMLNDKFGSRAVEHVKEMLKVKIKRKFA